MLHLCCERPEMWVFGNLTYIKKTTKTLTKRKKLIFNLNPFLWIKFYVNLRQILKVFNKQILFLTN